MTPKTTIVFKSRTGWNVRFTGNQARLLRDTCGSDAAPLPLTAAASFSDVVAHLKRANPAVDVVLEHA